MTIMVVKISNHHKRIIAYNRIENRKSMNEKKHLHRPKNGAPRIPIALQTVFLDGNRGIVVNTPPPDKSAMKTFFRWRLWGRSQANNASGTQTKAKTQKVEPKIPVADVNDHVVVSPRRTKKKKVSSHRLYTDASV
jgi:hypothetical protein